MSSSSPFPPGFFDRLDPSPDAGFYAAPRLVTHIDDGAIAAVGELYEELALDGRVLDLMSSWVSHFTPPPPDELVVLGLNEAELRANPAAAEVVVQDLNARPELPFDAGSFDHAVCCASVDYLTRPLEVFAEVAQVLRPGGLFVLTFSNRCFPTKAVAIWAALDGPGHCALVDLYLRGAGFASVETRTLRDGRRSDPLWAVVGRTAAL